MSSDHESPLLPPVSADTAVPDEALHALLDGQLSAHEQADVRRLLAQDAEATQRLAQWREQREALRSLHTRLLDEPVPQSMRASLERATRAQQRTNSWWRWGGMAAGLMLAFGAGWMSHLSLDEPQAMLARVNAQPQSFARQAAVAHVVYAVEQRHPVEVASSEQAHLVQWLSKRLGRPLSTPVLTAEGFELMGGRLLPGNDGARAQFMYQGRDGQRLSLYVGALDASAMQAPQQEASLSPSPDETAFRFTGEGPVPGFYWVDQGFGYALSGPLPRDQLARLARLVYQQL